MSLIQPVTIEPAEGLGGVHFIAIGGAGMSGIARIMCDLGLTVSGSDRADSPVLAELGSRGARVHVGHDADQLGDAQTVVVSSAIPETNCELAAARQRGLRVLHRSAALASLMTGRRGIAVGGTHGKTTTSAMIACLLADADYDPGYVIGAPLANSGASSHLGTGEFFVVEADESDGSFLQYDAEIAVVTNVEADHLENWVTPRAYAEGFAAFAAQAGHVVASIDDPGARQLIDNLAAEHLVTTYGEDAEADVYLEVLGPAHAAITADGVTTEFTLAVPGRYNLHNAAAAWAVGLVAGLSPSQIAHGLAAFVGTHRRFQLVGRPGGVAIYDDYAHHPTEVAATLTAARESFSGRLIAVFQPHLFSRTRDFATEFGAALRIADEVVVLDIYPAREMPLPGVTSQLVVDAAIAADESRADTVHYVGWSAAAELAAGLAGPGDVILTIGAGDVTNLGADILAAARRK